MSDTPWEGLFTWSGNPYYGYVENMDDALDIIQEFCYATSTSYTVTWATKNFGNLDLASSEGQPRRIHFQDDGRIQHGSKIDLHGTPFMLAGAKLMECHQGPRHRKASHTYASNDHIGYKLAPHKHRCTGSKKRGCPAAIYLREVFSFPSYQLPRDTPFHRRSISEKLRNEMQSSNYGDVEVKKFIFIDLPTTEKHSGHIMGEVADLKAPVDPRVIEHVNHLVDEGVTNVGEMKRHVRIYVKSLFGHNALPHSTNRRFFPSREDFRSIIYRRQKKNLHGLLDQDSLQEKITSWKKEWPLDHWFFRQSTQPADPEPDAQCPSETTDDQTLLLVYQSSWQQRLLQRYGQEMVFLDATYRTTRYAIPLFFLCVHTNCGYIVVATFVTERETSASLAEALWKLQEITPGWRPKAFMVDASDIEMSAINDAFPEAEILICDFHRKQALLRWTSAIRNNVVSSKEEILRLLNNVAESLSEEEYNKRLSVLQKTDVWQKNNNLRTYIVKEWLDKYKTWVWAFRTSYTLIVHTNNGVEAQNKAFKHEFLEPYRSKSLTNLMTCLVQDFFVNGHRKYLEANVRMSEGWREGLEYIPAELHHRPQHLIKHMRGLEQKVASIIPEMVSQLEATRFTVAASKGGSAHIVSIGTDDQLPQCDCRAFQITHLPCKHIAAIFKHTHVTWNSLPEAYRENPLFVVDDGCIDNLTLEMSTSSSVEDNTTTLPETDGVEDLPASVPLSLEDNTSNLHKATDRCRTILLKIRSLTFLVDSLPAVERTNCVIEEVYKELHANCPKSGGLLLETTPTPFKKKKNKTKQKVRELPRRRKRKHVKGRGILDGEEETDAANDKDGSILNNADKGSASHGIKTETATSTILRRGIKRPHTSLSDSHIKPETATSTTLRRGIKRHCTFVGDSHIKSVRCNRCEETFPSRGKMLVHFTSTHPETDEKLKSMAAEENIEQFKSMTRESTRSVTTTTTKAAAETMQNIKPIRISSQPHASKLPGILKATHDQKLLSQTGPKKDKKCVQFTGVSPDNILKELTVQVPIWRANKTNPRLHVCGDVIEESDIKSVIFPHWINDKVINVFLAILENDQNMGNGKHIYVMQSYLAELWRRGRFGHYLYKKVQLALFEWIFIPVNVNSNHWILLAANVPEKTVHVLDSLSDKPNTSCIKQWRRFMQMRAIEVNEPCLSQEWKSGTLTSTRQKDGHSCGAFVMLNAFALTRGLVPSVLTQENANQMRRYALTKILEYADKPPCQRTICDMVGCNKPGLKRSWVNCNVCGRWCHFCCVNITRAPEADYTCPVCNAQYS